MRPGDKLESYRRRCLAHLTGDWRLTVIACGTARQDISKCFRLFADRLVHMDNSDDALIRLHYEAANHVNEGVGTAPAHWQVQPVMLRRLGCLRHQRRRITPLPMTPRAFAGAISKLPLTSPALHCLCPCRGHQPARTRPPETEIQFSERYRDKHALLRQALDQLEQQHRFQGQTDIPLTEDSASNCRP
jgi:hypothetical protein